MSSVPQINRGAVHEAGHIIAADFLGISVTRCQIGLDGRGVVRVEWGERPRNPLVLVAGYLAERLWDLQRQEDISLEDFASENTGECASGLRRDYSLLREYFSDDQIEFALFEGQVVLRNTLRWWSLIWLAREMNKRLPICMEAVELDALRRTYFIDKA